MKMFFWSILGVVLFIVTLVAWSSYPWSLRGSTKEVPVIQLMPEEMVSDEEEFSGVVKILTWNLGYLYGRGSEGPGYEHREVDYYEKSLQKLVEEIQKWQPDVICLQEVDFESSRSGDINQAQYLAKKTGLSYVAEAVSWKANYIPFPYWPLKNNFGRMKSGGAILSRYPLSNHEVRLLPKPHSNPWWYNLFYLHRYFQTVSIDFGDKKFKLINLHLEAFDKVDRRKQLESLVQTVVEKKIDFVAGDFNMLPASATKKSKFYNEDDYENDPSYGVMTGSKLLEVIPDEIYAKDEAQYFTFPTWAPDRRLDYIWYRPSLKMMRADIFPSALSDHLPIQAIFQIDSPRFNPYSQ